MGRCGLVVLYLCTSMYGSGGTGILCAHNSLKVSLRNLANPYIGKNNYDVKCISHQLLFGTLLHTYSVTRRTLPLRLTQIL